MPYGALIAKALEQGAATPSRAAPSPDLLKYLQSTVPGEDFSNFDTTNYKSLNPDASRNLDPASSDWYRDANALVNQYGVSGFGDMWKNGQWRPGLYPNFNNDTSKWLSDQLTNWQAAADPGSWEDSVKGFVSDPGNLLTLVSGGGLGGFTGGQALTGGDVGGGLKKDLTGLAIGAGLAQVLPAIGLSSVAPATEGAAGTMTAQEGAGWLGGGTDPAGNVVGPTGAAVGNGAGTVATTGAPGTAAAGTAAAGTAAAETGGTTLSNAATTAAAVLGGGALLSGITPKPGDGGGTNAADEEARKAALRAKIDTLYGIGDSDEAKAAAAQMSADKTGVSDATRGYYTDQLSRSFNSSERNNRFRLARQGLMGGSADIDSNAELSTDRNLGATRIDEAARRSAADLDTQREQERLNSISLVNAGAGQSAVSSAQSGLKNSLANVSNASKANLFGDLFTSAADSYTAGAQNDALAQMMSRYNQQLSSYFPSNRTTSGRVTPGG
jgi:hypothetical protein